MKGSILVYGSSAIDRKEKITEIVKKLGFSSAEVNSADLLTITPESGKNSIGIKEAKDTVKFLQQKPFEKEHKIVIFLDAEKLTVQAQNSLLKTLEEPPQYASIILEVPTEKSVLDTIISRCQKVELKMQSRGEVTTENSFFEIENMTIGERLSWCYEFSKNEKEDVIDLLNSWIKECRENNNFGPIEHIILILTDLETTNVNTKLALEHLVIKIKKASRQ